MTVSPAQNIEKDGRQARLLIGILMLLFSLFLLLLLIGFGMERIWRLLVFLPWSICLMTLFQSRYGVDVLMASRGFEDTVQGRLPITDPQRLVLVKALARRVTQHALILALTLTILGLLIPSPDLEHISQLLQNRGY